MKKKLAALLCTAVLLCGCLGLSAMAAKPNVELMTLQVIWGNNCAYSPTVYFRNNTTKDIKYAEWYATAYNRVGDAIPEIATQVLTAVGPNEPFQVYEDNNNNLNTLYGVANDFPFKYYKETGYYVSIGSNDELKNVFRDVNGNFFVQAKQGDIYSATYLTEDEIQNAMVDTYCRFDGVGWYSNVISYIQVDKVVVTYMDGTKETIYHPNSKYQGMTLQNPPFYQQLAQYQAVYNYQDYLTYNPDLAALYGADQKKLFDHFVTSGMKEGRRGSSGFDLNTYKANNPELVAMFGDDNVKYYEHYIANGKAEGRIAA